MNQFMKCSLVVLAVFAGAANASAKVYDPNKTGDPRTGYEDKFTVPKGSSIQLCDNAKLSHVYGIRGDLWLYHTNQELPWLFACEGPLEATAGTEGVYHWKYDAATKTATCEFQGRWADNYMMVVTLKLTQTGTAIEAEVIGTSYPWNQPYGCEVGTNLGQEPYYEGLDFTTVSGMVRMSLHNVELDYYPDDETRNVKFYGRDGQLLKDEVVEYAEGATAPVPPKVEGYVFWKWDADFSSIKEDIEVKALYRKLFTVTFKDANGDVLKTGSVEETTAAEAPDMTGREGFVGWDCDFDYVTEDLVVTAVYGTPPDEVAAAMATGALENEANARIWCVAEGKWYTKFGVASNWKEGATAVFAKDVVLSVSEAMSVGKVLLLAEAKSVTFTGEAVLTFSAPATVLVPAAGTVRFETAVAGENGLVLNGADATSVVEIAGDYAAKGDLAVSAVTFKTVGEGTLGGGTFTQNLTIKDDGVVSLESSAKQAMNGQISVAVEGHGYVITHPGSEVSFKSNKGANWELRVAGDTFTSGYGSLSAGGVGTKVLAGGELSVGDMDGYWGPLSDQGPIYIYTNGVVRLVKSTAMGVSKPWYLVGGAVTNENTATSYPIVYKLYMNDGATFTGSRVGVGFKDYYDNWSFIEAGGSSPSTFAADDLMIGYQAPAERANHKIGVKFVVADVTGDDAPDFILKSPIVDREGAVLYKGEAVRENCGVWKTGPGTMLLTAATHNEPQGVFKIDEGAVRFGATCGGQLGALLVTGDAALEVEDDAGVAFADSSAVSWTEGKTLTLKSRIGKKSLRFGTDDKGLTAAQLAAIRYDESVTTKKTAFTLDASGYLRDGLSGGFCIRIR